MPEAGRRKSYNTAEWKHHQRRRVFERDGYRCQAHRLGLPICGAPGKQIGGTRTLTLAHLIPERVLAMRGRVAEDSELATVCRQCHGRADGGRRYGIRPTP